MHDASDGANGFVSLEVSPASAHDTGASVAEARHLWQNVARPNVMIKVPATTEGVAAVEVLISEGINVNITLMFSLGHYEAVAHAYMRGLDRHPDPHRVASVASVFVSRLDVVADRLLESIGSPAALSLRGRLGIANARRIYERFREIFYGAPLPSSGAAARASSARYGPVQAPRIRLYSDVSVPRGTDRAGYDHDCAPLTMDAFRDHGRVRTSLETKGPEADAVTATCSSPRP